MKIPGMFGEHWLADFPLFPVHENHPSLKPSVKKLKLFHCSNKAFP